MKHELEEELAASEEQRQELKKYVLVDMQLLSMKFHIKLIKQL